MSGGEGEFSPAAETDLDELWPPFGPTPPHRGAVPRHHPDRRRTPLSRAEIVRTAIEIADAEGSSAVNMRRIARELKTGPMSLYWHVADKDQLLHLMLDAVEGDLDVSEATGNWQDDLARLARHERQGLLRHPWVVDFIGGRPSLGPHIILHLEQSLALLDDLALDTRTGLDILMTLNTYVLGAVIRELREIRDERDLADIGADQQEIHAGMKQWQNRLRSSGQFTHFLRVFDEGIDPDAPETRDERFEFGLRCVLDGVAAQIARQER